MSHQKTYPKARSCEPPVPFTPLPNLTKMSSPARRAFLPSDGANTGHSLGRGSAELRSEFSEVGPGADAPRSQEPHRHCAATATRCGGSFPWSRRLPSDGTASEKYEWLAETPATYDPTQVLGRSGETPLGTRVQSQELRRSPPDAPARQFHGRPAARWRKAQPKSWALACSASLPLPTHSGIATWSRRIQDKPHDDPQGT
mmetsp:Transcript_49376/g.112113  ORF Transcript_49376/g.112113 Transcript_49376/m.112113 type:complete len:201 (-) Transcript_49376:20-622(-)